MGHGRAHSRPEKHRNVSKVKQKKEICKGENNQHKACQYYALIICGLRLGYIVKFDKRPFDYDGAKFNKCLPGIQFATIQSSVCLS